MAFKSTYRTRRHRNPQAHEQNDQPFFSKAAEPTVQTKEDAAFFQPRLTIGQRGGQYEQEADQMADEVVSQTNSPAAVHEKAEGIQKMDSSRMEEDREIQEKPLLMQAEPAFSEASAGEEEEPVQMQEAEEEEAVQMQSSEPASAEAMAGEEEEAVQMKSGPASTKADGHRSSYANPKISRQIRESAGKGQPLPPQTQAEMESGFRVSFRDVHIHTDKRANEMNSFLNAQAFTHGKDIYFNVGKYQPESTEGKRLLAHELTHVVQQGGDNDELINKNGRDSNSSNGSQTSSTNSSESLEEKLDRIESNYRSMISTARSMGQNVAADNLEHFLNGGGAERKLSVSWLRNFSEITDAEVVNQERFESSLIEISNKLEDGEQKTFDDYWDRRLTGGVTTELYYASGTSTIRSRGKFTLKRSSNTITITGKVQNHWFDPYDWHAGLTAFIPGYGDISDADALLLEKHRGASSFEMVADWETELKGRITIRDYWFDSHSFEWTGPQN